MPDEYGFEAGGAFAPAYEAAQRRLRGGFARQRGDLAQSLATRGVRTSGVGLIPEETLGRGQSESEAGLIGDFARTQALEGLQDRRLAEARAFQERQAELERQFQREQADVQGALARKLGREQLIGGLIGGGIGAAGSYFSGGLSQPRPRQRQPRAAVTQDQPWTVI